jgi:DnaK suppressor protein
MMVPVSNFTRDESNSEMMTSSPRWEGVLKSLIRRKSEILSEIHIQCEDSFASRSDFFQQLTERTRRELFQVFAAIERISKGKYGECEACEEEITSLTLRQFPYVRLCQLCQQRLRSMPV